MALAAALLLAGTRAEACCDVIPAPDDFDRAVLGSFTRPALIPGFPAELFVRPELCSQDLRSAAPDFREKAVPLGCDNSSGNPAEKCAPLAASQLAVNFFFRPTSAGAPHHAVVLRDDCSSLNAGGCALPNGGQVFCLDGSDADYEIVESALPGGASQRRLRFTFPDTTGLLAAPDDTVPLVGPITVAVTRASDPLPCPLATTSCDAIDLTTTPLATCADRALLRDGTCLTDPASVDPVDLELVALPPPTRFVDLCPDTDPSGLCLADPNAAPPPVPIARDGQGNLLVSLDYRDVLVRVASEPFPRTLRGAISFAGVPLPIKNDDHVESRAVNFAPVLPIFEPVTDPARIGEVFGAIDAGIVIHRIFGKSCNEDPQIPCSLDSECTAGCGVDNLTGLLPATANGAGPILAACEKNGELACQLGGTVTLDALTAAGTDSRVVAAPVNECVGQLALPPQPSRNDDADTRDVVMLLLDRLGFEIQTMGTSGSEGRALSRILDQPPFSFTTHDTGDEAVAFLEPESQECDFDGLASCDRNQNNLVFDHILRAFRLSDTGLLEDLLLAVTSPETGPSVIVPNVSGLDLGLATAEGFVLAAEPELQVQGAPVAVSGDLLFFRFDPAANAPRTISLASATTSGEAGDDAASGAAVSPEGGFVAFASDANNLLGQGSSQHSQIFLKDVATGEASLVSVKDRQSCDDKAFAGKSGGSFAPAVSADGRFVAFASDATNLLSPPRGPRDDTNGLADIFVHEPVTCITVRVSINPLASPDDAAAFEGNGDSLNPSISADGRFVVFESAANNLDPADTNPGPDVFLHDRDVDDDGIFDEFELDAFGNRQISTTLISVGGDAASVAPSISADGLTTAFASDSGLAADDGNGFSDVYVEDASGLARVSVGAGGAEGDAGSFEPSISASGRWVAFESDATTLEEGDTGGFRAVFVHDRESGVTRRVGVTPAPRECRLLDDPAFVPDGDSLDVRISGDGRFLAYRSAATNLDPADGSPVVDVFLEDLKTGAIARLSQSSAGSPGDFDSGPPSLSSDGSSVAFESLATNLGPVLDPGNDSSNVFLSRAPTAGGSRLGVLDLESAPPKLYLLDAPAEHVAVAEGVAAFVAPGENVKLLRRACGGVVGGALCDDDCASGCGLVLEDLLRAGVSAPGTVAVSERFVCAVVEEAGVTRPACHEIGTPPSASLSDIAAVPADSIQVVGSSAVFTSPEGEKRALYEIDLSDAAPVAHRLQEVEDVVLGDVACFTTSEADLGEDGNGDGDQDDRIMFVSDPSDEATTATSCGNAAVNCRLSACDPRKPFAVVPKRTCKYLADDELQVPDCVAAGRDLNLDGNCSFLVRRCTLGDEPTAVVTHGGAPIDPNARENPVEVQEGGDTNVAPACILPANPTFPLGLCPCAAPELCSDSLDPPRLFTLLSADPDGDGVLAESCDTTSNPDPIDCDADGIADACDGFVCGDGERQRAEGCDPAPPATCPATPAESEICSADCVPRVRIDVSESSINPGKNGKIPVRILSSEILNLDTVPIDGLPAQMIDFDSLRFAAVRNGLCMAGRCISEDASDGQPCSGDSDCGSGFCAGTSDLPSLVDDLNGDGLRDLSAAFPNIGSGIVAGTLEVCVTGVFSFSIGADPTPSFEARSPVNVQGSDCGLGTELALVLPVLLWLRGRRGLSRALRAA